MAALWILAFLALIGFSSSHTSDCSYHSLLRHLNLTQANDFLQITRPVKNWTTTTAVLMDMVVYGILGVDEKSQTMTSHVWLNMLWRNEFLTWNSSDFCGINMLTVPRSRLWIPDISILEDTSDSGSIKHSPYLSVSASGFIEVSMRQRLTSTCQLDLSLFPFDFQSCNITFSSMSYDANAIELGAFNNDTTLTEVSEQIMVTRGEWDLEEMVILTELSYKGDSHQSKLLYSVRLVRKPLLYVMNLIVPLFYLLVLDLASFFISDASGEKLSFKVTVLLSISVLLLILKDMLPSTETQLPMMANYCVVVFALVGISVLEAMLVSFLSGLDGYLGKKAGPPVNAELEADGHGACSISILCLFWASSLLNWITWSSVVIANKTCESSTAEEDITCNPRINAEPELAQEEGQTKPQPSYLPLTAPRSSDLLGRILEELRAARQEAERRDADKGEPGFYRRKAQIIDSVFFFVYFLVVVIYLLYMYFAWLHGYCMSVLGE